MATSGQMLSAGIADVAITFILIVMALVGDKILTPIISWEMGFKYSSTPAIDPGIIGSAFPMYYAMLFLIWLAVQVALWFLVVNREVNQYGMG